MCSKQAAETRRPTLSKCSGKWRMQMWLVVADG
jgi:hypothetical protein